MTLTNIDKVARTHMLYVLSDRRLKPVHLFFKENKYGVEDIYDWDLKKAELDRLGDSKSLILYVLGRASVTGNRKNNERLSQDRARTVVNYLQRELNIKNCDFRPAWFGSQTLQLTIEDARRWLGIYERDYRSDELILNQAVHVFVYPCQESTLADISK